MQTLADGNRIVRSTTGKYYRNNEGRVRRENPGGVSGVMGSLYTTGQGVSILNPSVNQKYLLDTELKTARVLELAKGEGVAVVSGKALTDEEKIKVEGKLATELKNNVRVGVPLSVTTAVAPVAIAGGGGFAYTVSGQHTKYETRTEELGTRDFEGVSAEGTRKTTIIPAGAIGNERPIEIVYERWYSKELGLVVYSKNTDPRFGEQTYKLINIVRAEPDPSLFSLPTGYKLINEASRISVTRAALTRATAVERTGGRTPVKATPTSVSAKPVVGEPVVYKNNFVD